MIIEIELERERRNERLKAYMSYVEKMVEIQSKSVISELVDQRKQQQLTQQDISDITGLKTSNIARFEKAEHVPTLIMLQKYASALGKKINVTIENDAEIEE